MAKQLTAEKFLNWNSNAKAINLSEMALEKQTYTKRDGSEGHSFVSAPMKATASGVSIVPNPGLGMDTAIVTLNLVREERVGDDRFKELMAEAIIEFTFLIGPLNVTYYSIMRTMIIDTLESKVVFYKSLSTPEANPKSYKTIQRYVNSNFKSIYYK